MAIEAKHTKARHKFEARRLDIISYLSRRPQGTSVMELARGVGVSLPSAERYLAKLKKLGDIELCRAEPIKGVSKRPIKYYVVSAEAELDMVMNKKGKL